MKQWNKLLLTFSVLASFCCGVSPFGGVALAAQSAPVVTVLPVFKDGTITPTRLASDSAGNIYVTDPHAEGVLKFNSVGKLMQKIVTAKEPGGIAFAVNGDLLVTQGTYAVALDPATGSEKARFGTFKSAFAITVDTRAAGSGGTGQIYVSDIADYCVQVFSNTYSPLTLFVHDPAKPLNSFGASQIVNGAGPGFFNRPAGVTFEKSSGRIAVVDSLNGKIQFFDPDGNWLDELGFFGYDKNAVMFTYPQSISFEYNAVGALTRAYVLDTNQGYVMVLDCTDPSPSLWTKLSEIGAYGHSNGNLIAPSDVLVDTKNPDNNRLFVSNGFGSLTVYGLASLQPYNVRITNITNSTLTVNWSNTASAFKWVRVYRSTVAGQISDTFHPVSGLPIPVSGDLSNLTTSFNDSGLNPYTTYYYTVRAVDNANVETPNIDQVAAKTTGTFGLTLTVVGSGQINGSVTCPGAGCSTTQASDSLITLTASASGSSVFSGWTGDCFTTADTCLITMDAAKSATATFVAKLAFRVDGAYFDNLQDAYREAKDGSVIKVMAGTWPSTTHPTEYMTAWQAKTVTIEGGYDAAFQTNAGGSSTVIGRTNLSAGKVIMKQFRMK